MVYVRVIVTQTGAVYRAKTVVITTGTYLRGEIIIGDLKYSSGPNNQQPSIKLSDHLQELGFDLVRFKTGTPPRVNSNTIDYSKTEIQPGDDVPRAFPMKQRNSSLTNCHAGSLIQMKRHMQFLMKIYIVLLCFQV